jgi:FkbM family methyltransferase
MLAGRSSRLVLRSAVEPRHYKALALMAMRYPRPREMAWRYLLGRGEYPARCAVRTPSGIVAPTVYTHHDVFTVHEIFGREDYRADGDVRVVVDIGSNIGISALYFMTRNSVSRCYLYEPVPRNVERLQLNLAGFESRYELAQVAVAARAASVDFTVEPSGRYGGIGVPGDRQIKVTCRAIRDVLDEVLAKEKAIDIVKIDTEGAELTTVAAIRRDQLERIGTLYFETRTPINPAPEMFDMRFACETCALVRLDD